eukprot:scaffold11162_cov159-Ochromonas_danica.AAC.2
MSKSFYFDQKEPSSLLQASRWRDKELDRNGMECCGKRLAVKVEEQLRNSFTQNKTVSALNSAASASRQVEHRVVRIQWVIL